MKSMSGNKIAKQTFRDDRNKHRVSLDHSNSADERNEYWCQN